MKAATAIAPEGEDDVLARVARAEKEALQSLYDRFARRVRASAMKHLWDRTAAEDLVQDVFLAAWVGAAGFRPERGSAEQWLFAITRNKIRDHWRRLARLSSAMVEVTEEQPAEVEPRRDPLDQRILTQQALAALTPNQRELVTLVYLKDLRFHDAARALGIPLGTVKSRIHTALGAMRAAIEGAEGRGPGRGPSRPRRSMAM